MPEGPGRAKVRDRLAHGIASFALRRAQAIANLALDHLATREYRETVHGLVRRDLGRSYADEHGDLAGYGGES